MPQQVRENVFLDRFISVLSAAFAVLATLLAAVGLYGVLAYTVAQRTREIGLRMALGAAPGRVRGMLLKQVGVMTLIGGAIGLAAALFLGRLARIAALSAAGTRSARACGCRRRAHARRARGRLHPRAPRLEGRSDVGAEVRVADCPSFVLRPWSLVLRASLVHRARYGSFCPDRRACTRRTYVSTAASSSAQLDMLVIRMRDEERARTEQQRRAPAIQQRDVGRERERRALGMPGTVCMRTGGTRSTSSVVTRRIER